MTRLVEKDIAAIRERLYDYDQVLKKKTGGGLAEIAAAAAGEKLSVLQAELKQERIGIIPLTTGMGIIGGFSDTVQSIFAFLGIDCFVTECTDVAGMNEALAAGATEIFLADDVTCSLMDLSQQKSVDNSVCTGRGFAAALAMKAGCLQGRNITVLGAGPVGAGAVNTLLAHGAEVVLYDIDEEKTRPFLGMSGVTVVSSAEEALQKSDIYFEATTAADTIRLTDMDERTLVAAPGVPLGVSRRAMEHRHEQVIHDVLEIGVASMVFSLAAEILHERSDRSKKEFLQDDKKKMSS